MINLMNDYLKHAYNFPLNSKKFSEMAVLEIFATFNTENLSINQFLSQRLVFLKFRSTPVG